jgi:hypothetical protein
MRSNLDEDRAHPYSYARMLYEKWSMPWRPLWPLSYCHNDDVVWHTSNPYSRKEWVEYDNGNGRELVSRERDFVPRTLRLGLSMARSADFNAMRAQFHVLLEHDIPKLS